MMPAISHICFHTGNYPKHVYVGGSYGMPPQAVVKMPLIDNISASNSAGLYAMFPISEALTKYFKWQRTFQDEDPFKTRTMLNKQPSKYSLKGLPL